MCVFPRSSGKRPETEAYWSHFGHMFTLNLPLWWEMESSDDWSVQFHLTGVAADGLAPPSHTASPCFCIPLVRPHVSHRFKRESQLESQACELFGRRPSVLSTGSSPECYKVLRRLLEENSINGHTQLPTPCTEPTGRTRWAHWYNSNKLFNGGNRPLSNSIWCPLHKRKLISSSVNTAKNTQLGG